MFALFVSYIQLLFLHVYVHTGKECLSILFLFKKNEYENKNHQLSDEPKECVVYVS